MPEQLVKKVEKSTVRKRIAILAKPAAMMAVTRSYLTCLWGPCRSYLAKQLVTIGRQSVYAPKRIKASFASKANTRKLSTCRR